MPNPASTGFVKMLMLITCLGILVVFFVIGYFGIVHLTKLWLAPASISNFSLTVQTQLYISNCIELTLWVGFWAFGVFNSRRYLLIYLTLMLVMAGVSMWIWFIY